MIRFLSILVTGWHDQGIPIIVIMKVKIYTHEKVSVKRRTEGAKWNIPAYRFVNDK